MGMYNYILCSLSIMQTFRFESAHYTGWQKRRTIAAFSTNQHDLCIDKMNMLYFLVLCYDMDKNYMHIELQRRIRCLDEFYFETVTLVVPGF